MDDKCKLVNHFSKYIIHGFNFMLKLQSAYSRRLYAYKMKEKKNLSVAQRKITSITIQTHNALCLQNVPIFDGGMSWVKFSRLKRVYERKCRQDRNLMHKCQHLLVTHIS